MSEASGAAHLAIDVGGTFTDPAVLDERLSSLVFKAVTTPDTRANEGNFRPLRVIAPPGSLMHAVPPSPTFTLWTGLLAGEVILKALAQGLPDLVLACSGGDVCSMMGPCVNPQTVAGGSQRGCRLRRPRARRRRERDHAHDRARLSKQPGRGARDQVADVHRALPLRPDSGGPGQHRAGLGVSRSYRFLADSTSSIMVYKTRTRPWAIGGGLSGENNHIIMNPGTPEERIDGGHYRLVKDGDGLVNNSAGGGGWGDPIQRDPARGLGDVRDGHVSVQAARDAYRVDLDVDRWAVNEETARLRIGVEQRPEPTPMGGDTLRTRPAVTATP